MTRRLLKTNGRGRGLFAYSHPEIGTWTSWEALPVPADTDSVRPLVAQGRPAEVSVSLYGDDSARRRDELQKKATLAFEKAGVRTPPWV